MIRVAGVFMALLLAVFVYGLGQSTSSVRVDTTTPPVGVTAKLKDSLQNESAHDNHVDDHEGNKGEKPPSSEAVRERTFLWLTSNQWTALGTVIIAIFTVVLAWGSCRQWKAIKEANEVARDAADATKRSVDAYVGRERGRLVIGECYRTDRHSNQIQFHYTNVGPTELTVLSFGAIPVLHVIGEDFSIPVISAAIATEVVKPGEQFGGIVMNLKFSRGVPGSITIPYEMLIRLSKEKNVRAMAAFRITYTTAFGHYVKQQVFVLENHGPLDIMHRDLCYDLPHDEWMEKHGKKDQAAVA